MEAYHTQVKPKLGWCFIVILSALPVLVYLGSPSAKFNSSYSFFVSLGRMTALAGTILYSINLILSTRLKGFEDYFGGLNRAYIAHHKVGAIALILLLFHPVFLALKLVETLSLSSFQAAGSFLFPRSLAGFSLSMQGIVRDNYAINNGIVAFFGMVVLLFITFFVKLPYHLWLLTHKFLGIAFIFAGLHILLINSTVASNHFLRFYMLLFVVLGIAAYAYRTLFGSILVRKYNYHVDQVNVVGNQVVELVMHPVSQPMPYQPGQFIFIRFRYSGDEAITTEAHPFSISSSPKDDFLRINAKALGDYTTSLMQLKPGAIAEIEGAYGRFSYQNYPSQRQIWIAGGIGITPFLSMAHSLGPNSPQVDLYYSVKDQNEFVHFDSLAQLVPQLQGFKCTPWITATQGLLTGQIVATQSGDLTGADIFICGPPPMMTALKQQFRAMGIPKRRLHTEEFRMQ